MTGIQAARRIAIGRQDNKSKPVQGRNGERREKAQISARTDGLFELPRA
jgi:hypothetical protein